MVALCLICAFFARLLVPSIDHQGRSTGLFARLDSAEWKEQGQWNGTSSNQLVRIDAFLHEQAPDLFPSLTAAKRSVRKGLIRLNGQVATTTDSVKSCADRVTSFVRSSIPLPSQTRQTLTDAQLEVLYEDEFLAVVNKPQGVEVFAPGKTPDQSSSLFTLLLARLTPTTSSDSPLLRPQPVHRLDAETGGLLLCAKTRPSLQKLTALFSEHDITKEYTALVANVFGENEQTSGDIVFPLSGQHAHTSFELLETFPAAAASLLRIRLKTGRTHQIRRHLDMIYHPVMFDKRYWFSSGDDMQQQRQTNRQQLTPEEPHCLFSTRLKFMHPFLNQDVVVELPEPPSLRRIVAKLEQQMK